MVAAARGSAWANVRFWFHPAPAPGLILRFGSSSLRRLATTRIAGVMVGRHHDHQAIADGQASELK